MVRGRSIHHDRLEIWIVLPQHRLQRDLQTDSTVVRIDDDGYPRKRGHRSAARGTQDFAPAPFTQASKLRNRVSKPEITFCVAVCERRISRSVLGKDSVCTFNAINCGLISTALTVYSLTRFSSATTALYAINRSDFNASIISALPTLAAGRALTVARPSDPIDIRRSSSCSRAHIRSGLGFLAVLNVERPARAPASLPREGTSSARSWGKSEQVSFHSTSRS